MKSIKLKMTPDELRALVGLAHMASDAMMKQPVNIAYINGVLLKGFATHLEAKVPYFKGVTTISIGIDKMSAFVFCAGSDTLFETLPVYEQLILLQINEAIDNAVRTDKRALEAYRNYLGR